MPVSSDVLDMFTFSSGHNVTELNFDHANLTFSGLPALDYFGDGSFYLLNTPGVSIPPHQLPDPRLIRKSTWADISRPLHG
jgi:hypothetical protein